MCFNYKIKDFNLPWNVLKFHVESPNQPHMIKNGSNKISPLFFFLRLAFSQFLPLYLAEFLKKAIKTICLKKKTSAAVFFSVSLITPSLRKKIYSLFVSLMNIYL